MKVFESYVQPHNNSHEFPRLFYLSLTLIRISNLEPFLKTVLEDDNNGPTTIIIILLNPDGDMQRFSPTTVFPALACLAI